MRFDRQILLLVFIFGSSHARPAPTISTAVISSTTSSDDDSPSLILDVSPQLISSVADLASEVVSAIFSEETSSTSRRATRQALDKESSASESYPPVALQTTRIAGSRNPQSVAVASSTATSRRIRTELSPAQGTTRDSSSAVSPYPATTHRRPQATSHTSDEQDTSRDHTAYAHPTTIYAAGAQPNSNSTGLNNTLARESELATMSGATTTVGGLLSAIGQLGALSGSDPAAATDLGPTTANEPTEPTNALDVLISALPTSVAGPIQSEYSDIIDPLNSGINRLTSDIFSAGESTSQTHTRPTRTPASNTPSTITSLTSTSQSLTTTMTPTTTSTALPPPPSSTEDPMSTMQTRPSNTNGPPPAATNNEAPTAANPSGNASTVGIATGVASGVVLVALAGVYLWRRHQQGHRFSFFARNNSKRSNRVYPEVAWLYDPDITPPHSRAGSDAGQHLIPEPRPGSVEMAGTPVMGGASPEMRPARPSSPLLAPVVRGSRDMVGSRSRSGSEVDLERLRPLSAVREEAPRGSMS